MLCHRRRLGKRPTEYREYMDMDPAQYRKVAQDRTEPAEKIMRETLPLAANEWCFILRTREQRSQKQLAVSMGVSQDTVQNMERAEVEPTRLINWWRDHLLQQQLYSRSAIYGALGHPPPKIRKLPSPTGGGRA